MSENNNDDPSTDTEHEDSMNFREKVLELTKTDWIQFEEAYDEGEITVVVRSSGGHISPRRKQETLFKLSKQHNMDGAGSYEITIALDGERSFEHLSKSSLDLVDEEECESPREYATETEIFIESSCDFTPQQYSDAFAGMMAGPIDADRPPQRT